MKNVFIKYNPYKIETDILIDNEQLKFNSQIREKIIPGARLQEWIEELPQFLVDEYNDKEFNIEFYGTLMDYEDVSDVFKHACNTLNLDIHLNRKPAKETVDKEVLIDEVFDEIIQGPFDELRDIEIKNAFRLAKSSDFEVCVVATMSAGKSTLINAMLGTKLMPSKSEACTAVITRIKDVENESNKWEAEILDKDGNIIRRTDALTLDMMNQFNANEEVSVIDVKGDIPFVKADDVSLVLIDTPGPNNSRDLEHKRVQSRFLNQSSKSLVLYIMEGTFGSDDDNALLQRVAESMKVGGKQSKDRFIFVVNKMDDRRKEDGETSATLDRIRNYLKEHGIENPNLFPVAALPALNIRMMQAKEYMDEDTIDETDLKVKKLNRNNSLHFEEYNHLPLSVVTSIESQVEKAKENGKIYDEALLHTGIPSVEAAIRQYVQKYAKTAKIKNIVDTFSHKLESVACIENTKKKIAENTEEADKIIRTIETIRNNVDSAKTAKQFSKAVDDAAMKVFETTQDNINEIVAKYQTSITESIDKYRGQELTPFEAAQEQQSLQKYAASLAPEFISDIEALIQEQLIDTKNALLEEYKNKIASLVNENSFLENFDISLDPLTLMSGDIASISNINLKDLSYSKKVKVGEKFIKNTSKAWWKPWTWGEEKGYYKDIFETKEFIDASLLAQEFLAPVQEGVILNGENVKEYVKDQSNKIIQSFNATFKKLDDIIKNKLNDLESYAKEKENAEENIKIAKARLAWLNSIIEKVDSILDI